jgi:hypothetical protein
LAFKREEDETMNSMITIRHEVPDDVGAIAEVTIEAFKTLEVSNHTEQFIIEADSTTCRDSGMRGCRRRSSSRCLSTDIFRRAWLSFTWDSKPSVK